jgi:hypothetical protein
MSAAQGRAGRAQEKRKRENEKGEAGKSAPRHKNLTPPVICECRFSWKLLQGPNNIVQTKQEQSSGVRNLDDP